MDKLWAPWRMKYITCGDLDDGGCFLCTKATSKNDRENLVLYRGETVFALQNLYPYNNGHLLIAPYRHVGNFTELDERELCELMRLCQKCTMAIEAGMGAHGFNIGINLGRVAGAGCADHLHMHIVPRWNGDTNFMPIIADTKVISESLTAAYDRLLPFFSV